MPSTSLVVGRMSCRSLMGLLFYGTRLIFFGITYGFIGLEEIPVILRVQSTQLKQNDDL